MGDEAGTGGTGAGDPGAGGGTQTANESLDAVMGAYVATAKQLPGVVPELIQGKTLSEVNTSIDAAKAAFSRVSSQVSGAAAAGGGGAAAPVVGSGAAAAGGGGEDKKPTGDKAVNLIMAGLEKRGQSR